MDIGVSFQCFVVGEHASGRAAVVKLQRGSAAKIRPEPYARESVETGVLELGARLPRDLSKRMLLSEFSVKHSIP